MNQDMFHVSCSVSVACVCCYNWLQLSQSRLQLFIHFHCVVDFQGHIKKHCALKRICIPDLIVNARRYVRLDK